MPCGVPGPCGMPGPCGVPGPCGPPSGGWFALMRCPFPASHHEVRPKVCQCVGHRIDVRKGEHYPVEPCRPSFATLNGVYATLAAHARYADHRDAERLFKATGWTPCGAGDWAIALRSPDGERAVRISPFDPTGPYNAALYREAAHTLQVPQLFAHRRLAGGGDLQLMEWMDAVDQATAVAFHRRIAERDPTVAQLVEVVLRVHARAQRELPWCGPVDDNPANVMRGTDRRVVVADLFYADGPNLYAAAQNDPNGFVGRIPENERRFMTEIPLAGSGPWSQQERAALRPEHRLGRRRPERVDIMLLIGQLIGQLAAARDGQRSGLRSAAHVSGRCDLSYQGRRTRCDHLPMDRDLLGRSAPRSVRLRVDRAGRLEPRRC